MIRDILQMQKRELELHLLETYIERDVVLPQLDNDLIKVIYGPRRAGKSFFAMHLLKRLGSFGYINFEDENLVNIDNYDELVATVDSLYNNPARLLLDEIQNLPRWELFVNRLQRRGYRLFISGSNAHLLSTELATHLTGRHIPIVLFPFSFAEYRKSFGKDFTDNESAQLLTKYLYEGGMPEPLFKNIERSSYCSTLMDSIIYKDIIKRFHVRAMTGMEDLARYVISNSAAEYSFNTLAKVTQCKSVHTVEKYLRYLETAFVVFSLRRFSFSLRKQGGFNKKIYCVDNGFITSKGFKLSPDIGRMCENCVAIELKKRELERKVEFFFWKNPQHEEVDFVVKKNHSLSHLIQVCWNFSDPKTKNREIRALLKAGKELSCSNLIILSEKGEGTETVEHFGMKGEIQFLPIWKWLLNPGL